MILYRTTSGTVVLDNEAYYGVPEESFDTLIAMTGLRAYLSEIVRSSRPMSAPGEHSLLAPIENQEVWASGVTYYRSRSARIEESKDAGGGDFYDRVYTAERPELFFKSLGSKVVGPHGKVRIRSDAHWSVPEPELTLVVNPPGEIIGYTIGNDMSSRDIEGVNPLYLPQAKVYEGSCALGPGIFIAKEPIPTTTQISIDIVRAERSEFSASTTLAELKRDPLTLVEYLYRDQVFKHGCFLLTGTGIVPPDSFTLQSGDMISISIGSIGTLTNQVA